jgi:hypothetical protein
VNYIIKDLMITVLPLRPANLPGGGGVVAGCDAGCTPCSDCSKCTLTTPGGIDRYTQVSNPADLAILKHQLREFLAMIEAREKVVHEAMRPKSVSEMEMLQAHLNNALETLRTSGGGQEARERKG